METSYVSPVDLNWRHPQNLRQQRQLVLPNGLEVLLVSNPTFQKSACAIDVHAGSLHEPDAFPGLAHFLEHMLFLGTSPFPEADAFQKFVSTHRGHSNAFTANEHTNYHFEINHDVFADTLERFASFFVSPLLSDEHAAHERKVVHAEFQKNHSEDAWRLAQMERHVRKPGHPECRFTVGNEETLAGVGQAELRAFFEKHYCASNMKAVLLSREPLSALESLARTHLSPIPNRPRGLVSRMTSGTDTARLPFLVSIEPIRDVRWLRLCFDIPLVRDYPETHPHAALAHLLGQEGEGSLLSLLKKKGLATALTTAIQGTSYASRFEITFTLTAKGVESFHEVIRVFFSCVRFLSREGYRESLFRDLKAMSEIAFVYRTPEQGGSLASRYARLMHDFPALELDERTLLLGRRSESDFREFAAALRPEKMQCFLVSKGLPHKDIEPYFHIPHSVEPLPRELVSRWQEHEPSPALSYPAPNPYIPDQLSVLESDGDATPRFLVDSESAAFVFQQDARFHLPKARLELLIVTQAPSRSPRSQLLGSLYEMAIAEKLREWEFPIAMAGLDFAVTMAPRGIKLSVGGFSQHVPTLVEHILQEMRSVELDKSVFQAMRETLERNLRSHPLNPPYLQAVSELKCLSSTLAFRQHESADLVAKLTQDDLAAFARQELFEETGIEGGAYGNLEATPLRQLVEAAPGILGSRPLPRRLWPHERTTSVFPGQPRKQCLTSQGEGVAYATYRMLVSNGPQASALSRLLKTHLAHRYVTELRTQRQLGYIVLADRYSGSGSQGLVFVAQSATCDAATLAHTTREWLQRESEAGHLLQQSEFDMYKKSLAPPLQEPDRTLGEALTTLLSGAFLHDGNFRYRETIAEVLAETTREEFLGTLRALGCPKRELTFEVLLQP